MSNEVVRVGRPEPTPASETFISILKFIADLKIPGGGLLIETFANWRSRVKQERINSFLKEMIEELKDEKIDYEYLRTEEFGDHVEDILRKIAENRSQQKKMHFKVILLASLQGRRQPEMSRLFLNIMEQISDPELELFSYFYRIHEGKEIYPGKDEDLRWFFPTERIQSIGLDTDIFKVLTLGLGCKGLILDDHFGEAFGRYSAGSHKHSRVTPLGLRFYSYITGT